LQRINHQRKNAPAVKALLKILPSAIAILISAGVGSFVAYAIVSGLGWTGLPAAFATLALASAIAAGIFAAGVALLHGFQRKK
jgi:hypothetical protein